MSIIHGRSTKAIRLFRDQPAALAVYWLYCARRNHEGVAYPSLRGLVKDTGWSINPCREARDWLVSCGALERLDQAQEKYIRPEWRILPETDRKHLIAFDKSEYYRVTGILVMEGKTYDMLYAPAKDADDVSQNDTSYSQVENDEQNTDVSLRETSEVSPRETSHAAQHAQDDTELVLSTSELDSIEELELDSSKGLKDSAPQNGAVAALEPKTIAPPIEFSSKPERTGLMEQSVIAPRTARPLPVTTPAEPTLTPEQAAKALRDAKKQIGADVDPVTERKRDVIFDAVAVHVFGITSDDELKALDATEHAGTRIGIITSWLRQKSDRVRLANGRRGTVVGFISHVAEPAHIEKFGAWCKDKQFDPPKDLVKFVENWRAFASEIKASKEPDGKKYISGEFADAINH